MLFCIDIGNTNTVLGLAEGDRIIGHWRIRTEREITSDELAVLVSNLFQCSGFAMKQVDAVIISCVVPPFLNTVVKFSRKYFSIDPMLVGPDLDTGIMLRHENKYEVGADRIVNAVAAFSKYEAPLIVVDFGTATTFDYVSRSGEYLGGVIAPGVMISSEALFRHASRLPRVEIFARPGKVIATDTVSCMNAGIIFGYAGLVDGIIRRMRAEAGEDSFVLATGGLAPLICGVSDTVRHVDELLTLEGLMIVYDRNKTELQTQQV